MNKHSKKDIKTKKKGGGGGANKYWIKNVIKN